MLLIYCFAENVFHYPHLITCVHIYKILIYKSTVYGVIDLINKKSTFALVSYFY